MNDLKIFSNEEFGEVRTVVIAGEPWFVGNDVSVALGYANIRNAVPKHVDNEDRLSTQIEYAGQNREVTVINESGLYALVFGSKLDSAKRFKRWVTSEVLPAIRKNGFYESENFSTEMKVIMMHDLKLVGMEKRMDKLEYEVPLYGCESDEISNHVKRKGVKVLGGKSSSAYRDSSIRTKVYVDIYTQLKREFVGTTDKRTSYKAMKRKYIADAHEFIDCYEPPTALQEDIDDANAQMSMCG